MADADSLNGQLPPVLRLALAYAPPAARPGFLGLALLDLRLAGIVRHSREPMLAQLRLAWWREQLQRDPDDPAGWPEGEPLLALLRSWSGHVEGLLPLVDAWEAMTGAAPLDSHVFECLAEARGQAFAALSQALGQDDAAPGALRMGRNWALADLAGRLSHPQEAASAFALARAQDWRPAPLPRAMRPLAVLHGLAARTLGNSQGMKALSPLTLLVAMRIGVLGR